VRLEELWNELAQTYSFCLFCAYSLGGFDCETHGPQFGDICKSHSHVIPAESYAGLAEPDERLREITSLQQKARALEAEILRRKAAENALQERLSEIEQLNARLKRSVTETHHRVKNNLQLMSALIEMQKGTDREFVPMAELTRLGQNIQALGVIHDILTMQAKENGEAQYISAKGVFEQLLPMLQGTLGSRRILFSVADVFLPGKQVTSLALIANELVSNAVKHGKGDIELSLLDQGGCIRLEVCDDGPGFADDFDPGTCAHTGLDLIENIARFDLRAETSYRSRETGGGCVAISFTAPVRVVFS
jgi:two-component sensor histidine kinase